VDGDCWTHEMLIVETTPVSLCCALIIRPKERKSIRESSETSTIVKYGRILHRTRGKIQERKRLHYSLDPANGSASLSVDGFRPKSGQHETPRPTGRGIEFDFSPTFVTDERDLISANTTIPRDDVIIVK
jgi:hypothetical protein